jgi:hypothetical protein
LIRDYGEYPGCRTPKEAMTASHGGAESRRNLARIQIVFMIVQETGDPRFQ